MPSRHRWRQFQRRTGRVPRLLAAGLLSLLLAIALAAVTMTAQPVSADWAQGGSFAGLGSGHIWSIAASPQNASWLIAGTDNGIYRSADGGGSWQQTANAGNRIWVVGFDLRNPLHVVAGSATKGILDSNDSGATWSDGSAGLSGGGRNVRCLAFSLSQIAAGTDDGVMISDSGTTWTRGGLTGVSVSALTVVANAPQLVLMAGTDSGDASQTYLWTNSGNTWTPDHGTGLPAPAVALGLASGPVSQAITQRPVVVDTSQGTFRSLDGGQTWAPATNLPTVGTATLTLTTSTFSPLDPDVVYGGADAGGSSGGGMLRSADAGVTYTDISQGLPTKTRNVVSIAVAQTTPPTVYVAISPPSGAAAVYKLSDAGAPPPPTLVAETAGGKIPTVVATPTPTARPRSSATPSPIGRSGGGIGGFLGSVFHWPIPLALELVLVLLAVYGYIRWRQHNYVAGPPSG